MPQMAPISWLLLFIVFSLAFMMFNIMNYYSFLPPTPKSGETNNLTTSSFNWKW
uniref:ATP synthase F0 subunit 8 n=1 Tax=Chrysops dissectus TaxID=2950936 RepID=UPI0022381B83|nr:ATP synthase F0 subunit 8 [Chrysops dissectus]UYG48431.1 ATP synthase F0 subunit 8 [Chrysops dissectus]